MKKVYVIVGETGEYSDSQKWNAKVSLDETKSSNYLNQLNAICKQGWVLIKAAKAIGSSEANQAANTVQLELQTLDSNASVDYTTGCSYTMEIHDLEE